MSTLILCLFCFLYHFIHLDSLSAYCTMFLVNSAGLMYFTIAILQVYLQKHICESNDQHGGLSSYFRHFKASLRHLYSQQIQVLIPYWKPCCLQQGVHPQVGQLVSKHFILLHNVQLFCAWQLERQSAPKQWAC